MINANKKLGCKATSKSIVHNIVKDTESDDYKSLGSMYYRTDTKKWENVSKIKQRWKSKNKR